MLYAVDQRELRKLAKSGPFLPRFVGAEIVTVSFRTDPAVLKRVLPKPLRAPDDTLARVFVAHYPITNFGVSYREGALVVPAEYKGEIGGYCLAMPVDDDMAMIGGRERFGFPKKIADQITLERDGDHVTGRVVRHGEEILHLEAQLTDDLDMEEWAGRSSSTPVMGLDGEPSVPFISFLFKHFPAADGSLFEWSPRLIRQVSLFRPREGLRTGSGKLVMSSTPTDPLGDIPVRDVVAAGYGVFDNVMLPGRAVATVRNPLRFAPHAWFSTDSLAAVDPQPVLTRRERRHLRKQVAGY